MSNIQTRLSDKVIETTVDSLECTFAVYKLRSAFCDPGNTRLYIKVTYPNKHSVSSVERIDIEYTTIAYEQLLDTDTLIDNLTAHFLEGEVMSKGLDEYYH